MHKFSWLALRFNSLVMWATRRPWAFHCFWRDKNKHEHEFTHHSWQMQFEKLSWFASKAIHMADHIPFWANENLYGHKTWKLIFFFSPNKLNSTDKLIEEIVNTSLTKVKNIATGETSQAITSFHFFDCFHFFEYFHFFDYFHFFWVFIFHKFIRSKKFFWVKKVFRVNKFFG